MGGSLIQVESTPRTGQRVPPARFPPARSKRHADMIAPPRQEVERGVADEDASPPCSSAGSILLAEDGVDNQRLIKPHPRAAPASEVDGRRERPAQALEHAL